MKVCLALSEPSKEAQLLANDIGTDNSSKPWKVQNERRPCTFRVLSFYLRSRTFSWNCLLNVTPMNVWNEAFFRLIGFLNYSLKLNGILHRDSDRLNCFKKFVKPPLAAQFLAYDIGPISPASIKPWKVQGERALHCWKSALHFASFMLYMCNSTFA